MTNVTSLQAQTNAALAAGTHASTPAQRGRRVNPNSAYQRARAMYMAARSILSRKELVQAFAKELDISPSVANTYVHGIRKKIKEAEDAAKGITVVKAKRTPKPKVVAVSADGTPLPKRGPGRPRKVEAAATASNVSA